MARMQRVHTCTLSKLAQLRWPDPVTRMPDDRLPNKIFYEELQERKRSQSSRMITTKTPLIALGFEYSNRLHRIEQNGVAPSTKEQLNSKQRESVKLKGSAKNAKHTCVYMVNSRKIPWSTRLPSRYF